MIKTMTNNNIIKRLCRNFSSLNICIKEVKLENIETGEVTTQAFDDVIVSHGFDHENPLLKD
jgi:hypothetical protein